MANNSLYLSELVGLSEEERSRRLAELARAAFEPANGELDEVRAKVSEFEARYEMTSDRMLEKLRQGELAETSDVCDWLVLLKMREQLD
jgi:predicted neutral ceramidase superfamily lipid hydrolase